MNGSGTLYGTFLENADYESFSPEEKEKVKDSLEGTRNFLTNPGKKGTGYGYQGLTLGPYPEYMQVQLTKVKSRERERDDFPIVFPFGLPQLDSNLGIMNYVPPLWLFIREDPIFDQQDALRQLRETYEGGLLGRGEWIPPGPPKAVTTQSPTYHFRSMVSLIPN